MNKNEEEKEAGTGEMISVQEPKSELDKSKPVSIHHISLQNRWQLKPNFEDFEQVEKETNSTFPYKMMIFLGNYSEYVGKIANPRGFTKVPLKEDEPITSVDFIWRPIQFTPHFYLKIDRANMERGHNNHIVINHLENIKGICTKTGLIISLTRYYKLSVEAQASGYSVHETTPTTFILMPECNDAEYQAFVKRFHELERHCYIKEKVPAKHCIDNVWLVKPAAMNQGRGIEIFKNNLMEMKKSLEIKSQNSYWVVQKYIERPLLYKGRKFDIRMWAVMTHRGELYYYREGYIRTSSDFYSLDSNLNYVHLTNNCLQQHGEKYGTFEEGNTVGFEVFKLWLKENCTHKIDFDSHIMPRMKDLMIDSYMAVKGELNPSKRQNCFELLGYDFMIDEDYRVWLIEINTNPYLGIPNKFIEGLLPKMLNDLLEIVLDPYVKPVNLMPIREVESNFEILYDEKKKINKRRSFSDFIYPIAELAPIPNDPTTKINKKSTKKPRNTSPTSHPKKKKLDLEHSEILTDEKKPGHSMLRKIIAAAPKPKKKLVDEAKILSETDNDSQFVTYQKRVMGCLTNWDILPEADIDDAVSSISLIMESKAKWRFLMSPLFSMVIKIVFDFTKEMPTKIRNNLVNLITKISQDNTDKKILNQMEFIHSLIKLIIEFNLQETKESSDEINSYIKNVLQILYNLANFDRFRCYIPGETAKQTRYM